VILVSGAVCVPLPVQVSVPAHISLSLLSELTSSKTTPLPRPPSRWWERGRGPCSMGSQSSSWLRDPRDSEEGGVAGVTLMWTGWGEARSRLSVMAEPCRRGWG
jgi:hypothetical protein